MGKVDIDNFEYDCAVAEYYNVLSKRNQEKLDELSLEKECSLSPEVIRSNEELWYLIARNDRSFSSLEIYLIMQKYILYGEMSVVEFEDLIEKDDSIIDCITNGNLLVSYYPGTSYNKVILVVPPVYYDLEKSFSIH